ncbi:type II toxin-antitoxin system antitoxin SocA domain-containing protein [Salinigranum sp. GCM10025319]|uniref:type II toxin-antitoxin system antitoxin SocA domain-containing protein n=1 Tax=Salinigranum sp. GCM10025319 TaxID=3252687 RepID=UPI0036168E03
MFYAEVYTIDNYQQRLSDVSFKPYLYGSFSQQVRDELEELDIQSQEVYIEGNKTKKYMNSGLPDTNLQPDKKKIIRRVHEITKSKPTEELAQFSKDHWLFKEGKFGDEMDFEKYIRHSQELKETERPLYDDESPDVELTEESQAAA